MRDGIARRARRRTRHSRRRPARPARGCCGRDPAGRAGNGGSCRRTGADRSPRARRCAPLRAHWRRPQRSRRQSRGRGCGRAGRRNLAGAGQHVVIADAGGMNAHEHIVGAGLRPLDLGAPASTAARRSSRNVTAFMRAMPIDQRQAASPSLCEGRGALLVVVVHSRPGPARRRSQLVRLRTERRGEHAPGAWSPAPRPANRPAIVSAHFSASAARRRPRR